MPLRPGSSVPTPLLALPPVELAGNYTPQDVASRLRTGTWLRNKRGVYVRPAAVTVPRWAALAHIAAVHHKLGSPHVFSHASAALLWGLTLWRLPTATHVYQEHHPGRGGDPKVRRHVAPLPTTAVTALGGLPVTTLEQTMVDCARTMSPLAGLVLVDSGLRAGASPEILRSLLRTGPSAPGMARARQVIELGDAGAESAWESATRFVLLRAGLPAPGTQIAVATRLGTFWADLGWEEWRVLLEYDGRAKYVSPDDLVREKRRQDAVAETGARMLRVTKEDVRAPATLVARTATLLPRGLTLVRRPHLRGR